MSCDPLLVRLVACFRPLRFHSAAILRMIAVLSVMSYGAPVLATASLPDDAVWLATQAALAKISKTETQIVLTADSGNAPRAVAVDEVAGRVWVYSKRQLRSVGFDGAALSLTTLPKSSSDEDDADDSDDNEHLALVSDPARGDVYLALHKTLYRFASHGALVSTTALTDTVQSMAVDRVAGVLFVASKTRITAYGPQLAGALTFSAGKEDISAISFDPTLTQLWVATKKSLRRYTSTGVEVFRVALEKITQLAADGKGAVWVLREKNISRIDASGLLLLETRLSVEAEDGLRALADVGDGSLWIAAKKQLLHINRDGMTTHSLNLPSVTRALALYADTFAPTLKAVAPEDGAYVNRKRPTLQFTADDRGLGVDTSSMEIKFAGEKLTAVCTLASKTASCTLQQDLPEGKLELVASVADFANNRSESITLHFTVDTLAPQIAVTAPVNDSFTNNAALTVVGSVSEVVTLLLNDAAVSVDANLAFRHAVTLTEGANNLLLMATDRAGNASQTRVAVTLDTRPPAIPVVGLIALSFTDNGTLLVQGQAGSAEPGAWITITNKRTGQRITVRANADGSFSAQIGAELGDTLSIEVADAAMNHSPLAELAVGKPLPPDPSTVAPPVDATTATTLASAVEFLYTGANPIQTGVAPGTINATRVSVLRGTVLDRNDKPLPGVTVTIKDHPEFGETLTRADGMFDLAVNGGHIVTLNYRKTDYLPVQRQIEAVWQNYAQVPPAVMIKLDAQVTTVDLNSSAPIQVARGSVVSDTSGARQATLMFPRGVQASYTNKEGATVALSSLHVRATEYTVGANGPRTMPAPLPAASGYTYAVELSVDEVVANGVKINGKDVVFSKPIFFHLENFLNFPVGIPVPVGYYDADKAAWIPSASGRVIKLLSVDAGGLAQLDIDGAGMAATTNALTSLGITDEERQQIAALYTPGQSLLRFATSHLSTWDCNWGVSPPSDATPAKTPAPAVEKPTDDGALECGSIIECENQILGERIPIAGTPHSLNYRSDRVPGRRLDNRLNIKLSNASIPATLKSINLEVLVAGRQFNFTFPPRTNLSYTFDWDGKDVYGRALNGWQPIRTRIAYVYDGVYWQTSTFGSNSGGIPITGSRARNELYLWQDNLTMIRATTPGVFPGWSIDVHHSYDPTGRVIYQGDGSRRSAIDNNGLVLIETFAGTGTQGQGAGGQAATAMDMNYPGPIAIAPDGSVYVSDLDNARVLKIVEDGTAQVVIGTGQHGYSGDGGPASAARFTRITGLAFAPDGSLYLADNDNYRIRRIGVDGIVTTVAGNGIYGNSGFGGPATNASIGEPRDIAFGPDGNLYIADPFHNVVLRVAPDGIISVYAGTGAYGFNGGGRGPAILAPLRYPWGLAVDNQGNVYIAESGAALVRRVGPDGMIAVVAGVGVRGMRGDGALAYDAELNIPNDVALGPDGSLYIADYGNANIRKVSSDDIITTIAGTGTAGYSGDYGPATGAKLNGSWRVVVSQNGEVYVGDELNHRIRKVRLPLPRFTNSEIVIASSDGSELYVFDPQGKHLRTLNAHTQALRYSFTYDAAGLLQKITDGDGNVTSIIRNGAGAATIVSPDGLRTELGFDAQGYLNAVSNANAETYRLNYTLDGLLTSFVDPKGSASTMTYDDLGRLLQDRNAAGGFWQLASTVVGDDRTVSMTSAKGRKTTHFIEALATGDAHRVTTSPDGTRLDRLMRSNGITTVTAADGTVANTTSAPDPRFGMQSGFPAKSDIKTPSGLTQITTTQRLATLSDANNPLSLQSLTERNLTNNRQTTTVFDALSRTLTTTSPQGRLFTSVLDSQSRPLQTTVPGIEPVYTNYDLRGRLSFITQGNGGNQRRTQYQYNSAGFLDSVTDTQNRTTRFDYDLAGRVTQQTSPDNRITRFAYDANGNLTAITPPGRDAYVFRYNVVDLEDEYTPPDLVSGRTLTQYSYNLDKQLQRIARPDGQTIDLEYDSAGRVSQQVVPNGAYRFDYHPTIGQLSTLTAPGGQTLSYSYDGFLPISETTSGAINGNVTRKYDNNFWLTDLSVNGQAIHFAYDNDGLLIQAGDMALSRNSLHGLLSGTSMGAITTSVNYTVFGELNQDTARINGIRSYDVNYARDALGRITNKTEYADGVVANYDYAYDIAGRLVDVQKNGVLVSHYDYDANGNRIGGYTPTGTINANVDAQDRLTSYNGITFAYTTNGELQSKTQNGQSTQFQYDVLGNLRQVTLPNSTVIDYIIDGRDRRVGKKIDGQLVQGFLYQDQLEPIAELDGGGNVVARFVYASKRHVPDYLIKAGTTYRLISDHLGSPRLVIDAITGAIVQKLDYDEFGNVIEDTNPGFQPFGFAGGIYDQHTKLTRFGARDYDAQTGRWTAKDPIRFAGGDGNLYGYAFNDPINFRDPNGRNTIAVGGGIGAAVGGPIGAAVGAAIGAMVGIVGYIVYNDITSDDGTDAASGNNESGAQDKKLSPGEIKKLKDAGFDIHGLKGGKGASKKDLFKDTKGNICVKPKSGQGPGDPLGININDF